MKTIIGVITDREHAEMAIDELKSSGYNTKDISIVLKDSRESTQISENTGVDVAGSTVTGVTSGAILGGLAGLLASTMIPGLGAFFIGGPIASFLGLTGAAASTASGAATGALAGGILGALTGLGLSEEDAKLYEERINTGGILIAVPAKTEDENEVKEILKRHTAEDIKTISVGDDRFEKRTIKSDDYDQDLTDYGSSYRTYAGAKGGKTSRKSQSEEVITVEETDTE